jgi:hypothetical protein
MISLPRRNALSSCVLASSHSKVMFGLREHIPGAQAKIMSKSIAEFHEAIPHHFQRAFRIAVDGLEVGQGRLFACWNFPFYPPQLQSA